MPGAPRREPDGAGATTGMWEVDGAGTSGLSVGTRTNSTGETMERLWAVVGSFSSGFRCRFSCVSCWIFCARVFSTAARSASAFCCARISRSTEKGSSLAAASITATWFRAWLMIASRAASACSTVSSPRPAVGGCSGSSGVRDAAVVPCTDPSACSAFSRAACCCRRSCRRVGMPAGCSACCSASAR